jgi:hypothetical protein
MKVELARLTGFSPTTNLSRENRSLLFSIQLYQGTHVRDWVSSTGQCSQVVFSGSARPKTDPAHRLPSWSDTGAPRSTAEGGSERVSVRDRRRFDVLSAGQYIRNSARVVLSIARLAIDRAPPATRVAAPLAVATPRHPQDVDERFRAPSAPPDCARIGSLLGARSKRLRRRSWHVVNLCSTEGFALFAGRSPRPASCRGARRQTVRRR